MKQCVWGGGGSVHVNTTKTKSSSPFPMSVHSVMSWALWCVGCNNVVFVRCEHVKRI